MNSETEFSVWVRRDLCQLNQQIDAIRFADNSDCREKKRSLKEAMMSEGMKQVENIYYKKMSYNEETAFHLLGDVGTFVSSCIRNDESVFEESTDAIKPLLGLLDKLALITNTAPRALIHHFTIDNKAIDGAYRGFTLSADENNFFHIGAAAIFAYDDAALWLKRVHSLGLSHPVCAETLLKAAKTLNKVEESYRRIEAVTPEVFYNNIRPYLRGYQFGSKKVRPFSAGDFGAANEVDLLIGVCGLDDPFYTGVCLEKIPYMRRHGQDSLRAVCSLKSILDLFLESGHLSNEQWFKKSGNAFLEVIEANANVAKRHHDVLVERYLTQVIPSDDEEALGFLDWMKKYLGRLRDLRVSESNDVPGGNAQKVEKLRKLLDQ